MSIAPKPPIEIPPSATRSGSAPLASATAGMTSPVTYSSQSPDCRSCQ